MKLLVKAGDIFDRIIDSLAFFAAVLIIFAMVLVSAEVVCRYFLHSPIIWSFEITEWTLLFICFLGTAWLLKKEGHVKVELLTDRLKLKTQAIFGIISSVLGVVICLFFVSYGLLVAVDYFQRGVYDPTVLELPKWVLASGVPFGGFLLLIQFLRRTYKYIRSWRAPIEERPPEVVRGL